MTSSPPEPNPFGVRPSDAEAMRETLAAGGLSPREWLAILLVPFVGAWFTLRKGTAPWARGVAFLWLFLFIVSTISNGATPDARTTSPTRTPVVTPVEARSDPLQNAIRLVREGASLEAAKEAFPQSRPADAKETDSDYAAEVEIDGNSGKLMFDASKGKLDSFALAIPSPTSRTAWLQQACAASGLTVKVYETPSAGGLRETGCYSNSYFATCVPDLTLCTAAYNPKGLPGLPAKREVHR